jgi:hypothetical protein
MGDVYLAEHLLMKRPCAIKVIRPEKAGDPKVLARFEREVQATAKLSHWNSVDIFDYGRADDGTFYYVMEYLPGMNLAAGESPRRALAFLAPAAPFATTAKGDRLVISAASYRRYDYFADAVATVDPAVMARAYRRLHGTLEAAHRALGLSAGSLDAATAKALRRIVAAPVRDGDVEVRAHEGIYELADPRLEDLGAVEKHLLRMGPRNTRIVQAKARALLDALRLPVVASKRP